VKVSALNFEDDNYNVSQVCEVVFICILQNISFAQQRINLNNSKKRLLHIIHTPVSQPLSRISTVTEIVIKSIHHLFTVPVYRRSIIKCVLRRRGD